jgi:hypothetical protein
MSLSINKVNLKNLEKKKGSYNEQNIKSRNTFFRQRITVVFFIVFNLNLTSLCSLNFRKTQHGLHHVAPRQADRISSAAIYLFFWQRMTMQHQIPQLFVAAILWCYFILFR